MAYLSTVLPLSASPAHFAAAKKNPAGPGPPGASLEHGDVIPHQAGTVNRKMRSVRFFGRAGEAKLGCGGVRPKSSMTRLIVAPSSGSVRAFHSTSRPAARSWTFGSQPSGTGGWCHGIPSSIHSLRNSACERRAS